MKLSAKGRKIVASLRNICKRDGVRIEILKGSTALIEGETCGGYFAETTKKVVVSSIKDEVSFLALLFHEFGHFLQWRDYQHDKKTKKAREWEDSLNSPNLLEAGTYKERRKGFIATLALEVGAERTALTLLRKHKIGSKADQLLILKTAAIYLYCHRFMLEKKRWFKKNAPLNNWLNDKELYDALPNTLRGVDFSRLPKKVRKLLLPLF